MVCRYPKNETVGVSMNKGVKFRAYPNKEQQNLADFLFNNGVDVILGNHSHVPQQMEKRTIKLADWSTKDGFVIYSLGNFMANQNKQYTNDSAILKLQITKTNEKIDQLVYELYNLTDAEIAIVENEVGNES